MIDSLIFFSLILCFAEPDTGREPFEDTNPKADGRREPQGGPDPIPHLAPSQPKRVTIPTEKAPAMRSQTPPTVQMTFPTVPAYKPEEFPAGPKRLNHSEIFHRLPLSSQGRWLHSAVILGAEPKVYIFGGIAAYSDRLYNDLWVFDYKKTQWFQMQRSYVPPFPSGETKPKDVPAVPDLRAFPDDEIEGRVKPHIPVMNPEFRNINYEVAFAGPAPAEAGEGGADGGADGGEGGDEGGDAFVQLNMAIKANTKQLYDSPSMSPSYNYGPTALNNRAPFTTAPPSTYQLPPQNREQARQRAHYPQQLASYPSTHPSPFAPNQATGNPLQTGNAQANALSSQYVTVESSAVNPPMTRDAWAGRGATDEKLQTAGGLAQNPALLDWRSLIGLRPERDGLRDWPAMPTDLWSYDVDKKTWQCILPTSEEGVYPAPAPPTRWLHSAVGISNRMLVFGGATVESKIVGDLWIFNPEANSWQLTVPKGTPPLPRQGHCAAASDRSMYIFGGISYGYQPFNDFWQYNVIENSWTELSKNNPFKAPAPRWLASCALVTTPDAPDEGRFFVFGGVSQEYVPMNDLMIYDLAGGSWSPAPVGDTFAPFPRMMHNMVWMGSRLYVFGGMANNLAFEDLHYYDLDTNKWSETLPTGSFPFARGGASATVLVPPPRIMPERPTYESFAGARPSNRWVPRFRKAWNDNRFMFVFGGVGTTQVQDY